MGVRPHRALEWGRRKYEPQGIEPAIVGATIRLGYCLNLLDIEHADKMADTYQALTQSFGTRRPPVNTLTGAHFLDRLVIDTYCNLAAEETSPEFQTVRGCFPEGKPFYAGSKILELAHVQIAVRDARCLSRLHLVNFG